MEGKEVTEHVVEASMEAQGMGGEYERHRKNEGLG